MSRNVTVIEAETRKYPLFGAVGDRRELIS
jgi:hypothetical protein